MSNSNDYDVVPKLMITTHGKWNVPRNSSKGHPKFKLPYNVRIMYATGMGVVNYLDQTLANRINKEYRKKNKYGMRKINKFKKDLRSFDLYGCCDALACKDNRRNSAHIIRQVIEDENDDDYDSNNREDAKEFLDHTDEPYRITSKKIGSTMPLKTHEISIDEFGVDSDGYANRDSFNLNDNRVILYIQGRDPIDILYHWDKLNNDEPFISAKLRQPNIQITFEEILARVKDICEKEGIVLTDLDIIDLSCNVTTDVFGVKAPSDPAKRAVYINTLRDMVFGDDEISSSSSLSSSSSSSNNNKDIGFFAMLLESYRNPRKKQTKKKTAAKSRRSYAKSRRSYALPKD
jgi:hypothetical protein